MKIHGIKRAVGDFNHWIGHAEIVVDVDKKKVWTDIFTSPCSEKRYADPNIVTVKTKGSSSMASNWDKTSMAEVEDRAKYCISSGLPWY